MILSRPIDGLRALVRRVTSEDTGSSIMEVIGAMVVITITTSAFLLSFNNMSAAQNRGQSVDIAGQYARGVLEEAKATPWQNLCFETTDPNYRSAHTVKVDGVDRSLTTAGCAEANPIEADKRILPTESAKVRGLDLDVRTDIVYTGGDRRVKNVIVEVKFARGDRVSTNTYSTLLSARPDVRAPLGIPEQ